MMVGGERLLITLTTGILGYVSQNKQKNNLNTYSVQLRHHLVKYRLAFHTRMTYIVIHYIKYKPGLSYYLFCETYSNIHVVSEINSDTARYIE